MKVLWFAVSPSLYSDNPDQGLGWISSLETIIRSNENIDLGIAFEHSDNKFKVEKNGVAYYPMNVFKTRVQRFKRRWNKIEEELFIPHCLKVIDDFKPDVIHVFGAEWCYGLVQEHTTVPVVIHIQGSIPPYNNASLPPGYGKNDYPKFLGRWKLKTQLYRKLAMKFEADRGRREERILKGCKYFMGRTDWDFALTKLYAPESRYFKCWEALRPAIFSSNDLWNFKSRQKFVIVTTGGRSLLKGNDTILKTAKKLVSLTNIEFEWRIIGADNLEYLEWHEGIKCSEVNIKCLGTLNAQGVKQELLNSDLYVHPAYIDNSPNAVCEAMCLGVPIITTFVGGIPSLISHQETGILVAANDPFTLAFKIKELQADKEQQKRLSENAKVKAKERHDTKNILEALSSIYTLIKQIHEDKD